MKLSIDLETRSVTNLLTDGAYNYASCPTTEIICMSYAADYGDVLRWLPGDPVPKCFHEADTYHAWNAAFERLMFDYILTPDHGFPQIQLEEWRCTMFKSACNNMPAALGNAARCLNVEVQKQKRGRELIKLLCLPLADNTFNKDPELLQEMYSYCDDDVGAEMGCDKQLREPTTEEWSDYHAQERINDRGILVDLQIACGAQAYAEEERDLIRQIQAVTAGEVLKAEGRS